MVVKAAEDWLRCDGCDVMAPMRCGLRDETGGLFSDR